jgi:hypothetical protein
MIHAMTKMIVSCVVLVGLAGTAFAQPASPTAPASPTSNDAQPPAPAPPSAETHPVSAAEARKLCATAMTSDPTFAADIVKIADEAAARKRDADTVAAHVEANARVQKNERHVIYAYAAMWILAAAFVIFLWRRQQVLKVEIAGLRRDLEAAAADVKPVGRP